MNWLVIVQHNHAIAVDDTLTTRKACWEFGWVVIGEYDTLDEAMCGARIWNKEEKYDL